MLFITKRIKRLGMLSVLEWSMLKTALVVVGIIFAKLFPALVQLDWIVLIVAAIALYIVPLKKIFSDKK